MKWWWQQWHWLKGRELSSWGDIFEMGNKYWIRKSPAGQCCCLGTLLPSWLILSTDSLWPQLPLPNGCWELLSFWRMRQGTTQSRKNSHENLICWKNPLAEKYKLSPHLPYMSAHFIAFLLNSITFFLHQCFSLQVGRDPKIVRFHIVEFTKIKGGI